jgi:hypothetical protein
VTPALKGLRAPLYNPAVRRAAVLLATLLTAGPAFTQTKPRARDLGVPFEGAPGPLNAITDVRGVEVGMTTVIRGEGAWRVG